MLIVLSPAKTLDYESKLSTKKYSEPLFLEQSSHLIARLRKQSSGDLQELMGISAELARLNHERFNTWTQPFDLKNARQAMFAFNGDVYDGLNAKTLDAAGVNFAQKHIRILSGLYGVLKPLDLMQPYRLEMGTRLVNDHGKDLYQFWGNTVSHALQNELASLKSSVLVNLASEEYFKVVRPEGFEPKVQPRLITPVFEDFSSGEFKVVSFFAKRARGAMARFIIDQRVQSIAKLKTFSVDGYSFEAAASKDKNEEKNANKMQAKKNADKKLPASSIATTKTNQFLDSTNLVFRRKQ